MNNKIRVVLRNPQLCNVVTHFEENFGYDYPVHVVSENTNESIIQVKKLIQDETKVIISGEAFGPLLMRSITIPIIVIHRGRRAYEKILKDMEATCSKIAIVCYETETESARYSAHQVSYPVKVFPYHSTIQFSEIVKTLAEEGFADVIGPTRLRRYADDRGVRTIPIPYNDEDLSIAFKMAEHTLASFEEQERLGKINRVIQDVNEDGVLFVDKAGIIGICNKSACNYLGKAENAIIGRSIFETELNCPGISSLIRQAIPFSGVFLQLNHEDVIMDAKLVDPSAIRLGAVLTIKSVHSVQEAEQLVRRRLHRKANKARYNFSDIIGKSEKLAAAKKTALRFAAAESPVLVLGETGVGKELFAQSMHNASRRKNSPFVAINCAALPENLIESELFGYEKGAFTGALSSGKQGLFAQAHTGTIFLDEIGELPLHVQVRFLRVLQEQEVIPIGSTQAIPINVRVIAATNRNLEEMVETGEFRRDLYYRISVLSFTIPPLRERREDIIPLVESFVTAHNKQTGSVTKGISEEAINYLCMLPLYGNVRQLSNIIERAIVLSDDKIIDLQTIKFAASGKYDDDSEKPETEPAPLSDCASDYPSVIKSALKKSNGNKKKAAELLGISRATLYRKMTEFGLQ